jgi:hypothetical protein
MGVAIQHLRTSGSCDLISDIMMPKWGKTPQEDQIVRTVKVIALVYAGSLRLLTAVATGGALR